MNTIEIQGLTKVYGDKKALNNISIDIKGAFGLLGPNGAGKTTLMRIMATLDSPQKGTIIFNGRSWGDRDYIRQMIGYLPQSFSVYKSLRVVEVLNHFAILKGLEDKSKRFASIESILHSVNLYDQKDSKVKNLSGGMLRRLGIAQSLIGNPKILIVDEPTAGLDIEERVRFRKLLRKISNQRIIIISTHIVEDLESTCDNIAIIKNGNVIKAGTRREMTEVTKGKVWEINVPIDNINHFIDEEMVISTKQLSDHYIVRFFSEQTVQDAYKVEPSLEDAYLFLMKDNNIHD